MAEIQNASPVTRPQWYKTNSERFDAHGERWHTHAFTHVHADGGAEHDHGTVVLTEEFVETLTALLEQVTEGRRVDADLAAAAADVARELR